MEFKKNKFKMVSDRQRKKESNLIKEEYFFRIFEQDKDYLEWAIIKLAGTIKNDKIQEEKNKKNEILEKFIQVKNEEILNIEKR